MSIYVKLDDIQFDVPLRIILDIWKCIVTDQPFIIKYETCSYLFYRTQYDYESTIFIFKKIDIDQLPDTFMCVFMNKENGDYIWDTK